MKSDVAVCAHTRSARAHGCKHCVHTTDSESTSVCGTVCPVRLCLCIRVVVCLKKSGRLRVSCEHNSESTDSESVVYTTDSESTTFFKHTTARMHKRTHVQMQTHPHIPHIHTYTLSLSHTHTHTHTRTHTHAHAHAHAHAHVHVHTHIHSARRK